jgi:acetyltransferase-like isoleucine patch superfamily enzyme
MRSLVVRLYFSIHRAKISGAIDGRGVPYLRNLGVFEIGRNFRYNSNLKSNPIGGDQKMIIIVTESGRLRIGDNVGVSNSAIFCTNSILIGNNVMIGGSCKIYDTDFHSSSAEVRKISPNQSKSQPIIIEDDAWLAMGVVVLKGVTIGKGSVVSAGSVVSRSIPPYQLWAGNPAQFVRHLT